MEELKLTILSGERRGHELRLSPVSGSSAPGGQWICNKEAFEIALTAPVGLVDLELNLYDYCEPCHQVVPIGSDLAIYKWQPARAANERDKALFYNYFGIAEISISGTRRDSPEIPFGVTFEPIEVLVDERDAAKIAAMFDYLAMQSPEALYSAFSATQVKAGHSARYERPSLTIERLEKSLALMVQVFPALVHLPITRLVPESKLVSTSGQEYLDDAAIGWLMENMGVLSPAEAPEMSHLLYQDQFYRADNMVLPVLLESTDLYENQIIHGFVALLRSQAEELIKQYAGLGRNGRSLTRPERYADGFVSFFSQLCEFRDHLLGRHLDRCKTIVSRLHQLEQELRQRLPVKTVRRERPYFTQKVQTRPAYRELFSDIIRWHERGKLDWSAFENLFAIESLPSLFEYYCYFRTAEATTRHLLGNDADSLQTHFELGDGTCVAVLREPHYWMPGHANERDDRVVNSEGYTAYASDRRVGTINGRSRTDEFSRRSPDVVIEITRPDAPAPVLLVMDAKYTHPWYAFTRDLPSLTLKYVHGIHSLSTPAPPVVSLTILHPLQERNSLRSYHGREFNIFSERPVQPSLQCQGVDIVVQPKPEDDGLHRLVARLLALNGCESVV